MSANLNLKDNGEAAFFSVKEKAWHNQGCILDSPPTSEEAVKLAGLDYDVIKSPIVTAVSGEVLSIPTH